MPNQCQLVMLQASLGISWQCISGTLAAPNTGPNCCFDSSKQLDIGDDRFFCCKPVRSPQHPRLVFSFNSQRRLWCLASVSLIEVEKFQRAMSLDTAMDVMSEANSEVGRCQWPRQFPFLKEELLCRFTLLLLGGQAQVHTHSIQAKKLHCHRNSVQLNKGIGTMVHPTVNNEIHLCVAPKQQLVS